jgi:hypothetical protein
LDLAFWICKCGEERDLGGFESDSVLPLDGPGTGAEREEKGEKGESGKEEEIYEAQS